jgi:hypothetical protein
MDDLERRAKSCVSHNHGCDCREWAHQQEVEGKDALLREAVIRLKEGRLFIDLPAIQDLSSPRYIVIEAIDDFLNRPEIKALEVE